MGHRWAAAPGSASVALARPGLGGEAALARAPAAVGREAELAAPPGEEVARRMAEEGSRPSEVPRLEGVWGA
jgi:hypothetical protein